MIIVQLTGGLGNQMFQYALAKKLSINTDDIVKIDTKFFETYEWHEYSLKPFNLSLEIASEKEVTSLTKGKVYAKNLLNKLFNRFDWIQNKTIFKEQHLHAFDINVLKKQSNVFLIGYWQSFRYFPEQSILLDSFTPKVLPNSQNQLLLQKIAVTTSVSLHIRRGNYVAVASVASTHGVCSKAYYDNAVAYLSEKVKKPCFFIFSDDIEWAKSNIQLDFETIFVDINDAKTDYEDLRLMYSCKHNIIANSTFSWWGAWLNQNPSKIVIAPKKWYNNNLNDLSFNDFIPQEWKRLE